jgi:hypothetical protein
VTAIGLAVILAALVPACTNRTSQSVTRRQNANDGTGVALSLTMVDSKVPLGGNVVVKVKLTNHTNGNVWINSRMLLNAVSWPSELREVWIMLQDPDNHPVSFDCLKNIWPMDDSGYRVLAPGKSVEDVDILSDCFRFDRPGKYKLAAFYQDGQKTPPRPPPGSIYVSQLLESAPTEVEIVGTR